MLGRRPFETHLDDRVMRQAIVSIRDEDITESTEVISLFREAGLIDTEVLSCDWTGGIIRARFKDGLDEDRLDEADTVAWWERVSHAGSDYVYIIEMNTNDTSNPMAPETDDVLPVNFMKVDDGGFTFDISGTQEGIREVVAGFEEADVNLTLQGLHEYRDQEVLMESLTERQQEVLQTAYANGYYDVPRSTSTMELAEELGVDGSTIAEHLQRAERNLVTAILND